jgi:hypothetical protein
LKAENGKALLQQQKSLSSSSYSSTTPFTPSKAENVKVLLLQTKAPLSSPSLTNPFAPLKAENGKSSAAATKAFFFIFLKIEN